MQLLRGLTLLLIAQALGEVLVRLSHAPLPGPVLGLLLMLLALRWGPLRDTVQPAAEGLLGHLSLLFVPVGVGVMTHLHLIGEFGLRLLLAVVLSTGLGLAVTAWVLRALLARERKV
ncbi:CidA/LrgA family protein [Roseateles saccharophilus]|uniref:CidA/LrgA family protein n=1 Tax=Roseateles saccharophilus TaxID=304 RepID=UPI001052AA4C|nr:CidA/LrgA family protein [Roseateles saccharophilus]MDG0835396.1 CidA/LrgA family protein [Roseateles saccharophilus]